MFSVTSCGVIRGQFIMLAYSEIIFLRASFCFEFNCLSGGARTSYIFDSGCCGSSSWTSPTRGLGPWSGGGRGRVRVTVFGSSGSSGNGSEFENELILKMSLYWKWAYIKNGLILKMGLYWLKVTWHLSRLSFALARVCRTRQCVVSWSNFEHSILIFRRYIFEKFQSFQGWKAWVSRLHDLWEITDELTHH